MYISRSCFISGRRCQGVQREAIHEHYQYHARYRQDLLDALCHYETNLQSLKDCERHLSADMAGAVLATILDLQQREAWRATQEAKLNGTCNAVTVAHSDLTKEHEARKKELTAAKEEAAAAQICAVVTEQWQQQKVQEINPEAVSRTLPVTNRHIGAQEEERGQLEHEL